MAAGGDTAALVVALSAQLSKFEKDMKDAVKIADTRTKEIETRFSKMNQTINNEVSGFVQNYATRLGALGTVLTALGPIGLTIAAGVGVAAVAIGFLSQKADQFVQKQKAMREAAEVTGLTLDQLKAVGQAATATGVDFEKAERGIIKMVTAIDDLRSKGQGPLLDSLNKLNPELVKQVINANSSAEAFDILAKALDQMEGDFKKVGFAADLFGKRNVEMLLVLKEIVKQGGLVKTALDLREQGKGIDEDLNKRLRDLQAEIDATKRRADNIFGATVALLDKQAELDQAKIAEKTAQGFQTASGWMKTLVDYVTDYISKGPGVQATTSKFPGQQAGLTGVKPFSFSSIFGGGTPEATRDQINKMWEGVTVDVPLPTTREQAIARQNAELDKQKAALLVDIQFWERWAGVLGGAASPAERLFIEQTKINKALQDYAVGSPQYNRLVEAGARATAQLTTELKISADQVKERLFLLGEEQIVQSKLTQAKLDAQKAGLQNIDLTKAEIIFRQQAKETTEQQAAALSKLPESTRFSQQALDGFKQADRFLVGFASNFENAMGDIALGTKTGAQAFKALSDAIIRDLVRITIQMSITGPLLKAFGSFFGGGLNANSSVADLTGIQNVAGWSTDRFLGMRQGGGPVSSGRGYIVGEHGAELFVPSQSGSIVPDLKSSRGGSMGSQITVNNYAAADTDTKQTQQSGPNGERIVIDIIKKAHGRGEFDDVNRGRFALRPAKVR